MSDRTDQHLDPAYRASQPKKPLYASLDNDKAPMEPHVLCVTKATLVDKAWTRFVGYVTRHFLGLNAKVAASRPFEGLESYGVLEFKDPIRPCNHSNTLRGGFDVRNQRSRGA